MVNIVKQMCPTDKYSLKCPYSMNAEYITIHNTANSASSKNEVTYMLNNTSSTSYHFAVDDIEIRQAIPINRNAWHAGDGNGKGNRASIGIEICYSTGDEQKFAKAEDNCAEFVASMLKERGWGIDRVKKHQDWSGKYCPHKTLDLGWDRWLDKVRAFLGESPAPTTPTNPTSDDCHTHYAVYTNKWLPEVTDDTDYAGIENKAVSGLYIKATGSEIRYRVHILGKGWLGWVCSKNTNINDSENGYAGIKGQKIDAIQCFCEDTNYDCVYRVSPCSKSSYYAWVTNTEDYAGVFGQPIDKVQITIKRR